MVKLIFLCRRRPDITHEQYAEHLLRKHVPLALKHHPTLRRYVVNLVEQSPAGLAELDSIGELFFDSVQDFRERLYDSPQGQQIIQADVAQFIAHADAYAATEHVQKSQAPAVRPGTRTLGVKLICPLQRKAGLNHDAFVQHWLTRHAPLAKQRHSRMTKYVTNVVDQRLSNTGEDWDGFAELHFASPADATERLFDTPEGERIIREDIDRFIGRVGRYQVAEYVQRP
jgi:uncharacterized protein (TIGR02118 family)